MKIAIHVFPKGDFVPVHIGHLEMEKFDAEECFRLCNWTQWATEKPKELHSEISAYGRGICFTNPETGKKWLAKTSGWLIGTSTEITDYVMRNRNNILWL